MLAFILSIVAALVAGVSLGFQNPLAALMGRQVGLLQSAFIIHLGGTILAGGLIAVVPGGRLAAWPSVPWYALGAGALGVAALTAIAHTIPRIGVAATVGLLLAAQLSIAAWLDHHGWLGAAVRVFDPARLAGLVLLLIGAWLVLR